MARERADERRGEAGSERGPVDRRADAGPFDIIGDVHGCADELVNLLGKLGYGVILSGAGERRRAVTSAPAGRRAIFVGDLVDRGPAIPDALRIAMGMVGAGHALAVPGNHDVKFVRWLKGREVALTHGMDRTVEQMTPEPDALKHEALVFFDHLPSHLWLDGGQLAVAHAGVKEHMLGGSGEGVRRFCLYGETSGAVDAFGLAIRYHWALEYGGRTSVVYGHTPVPSAEWVNNTLCIDTGCCFGGKLTALRWPEREIVSVPAARVYMPPGRPFGHPPPRPSIPS